MNRGFPTEWRGAARRITVCVVALILLGVVAALPRVRSLDGSPVPTIHYETRLLDSAPSHLAVIGDSYTAGSVEGGEGPAGWAEQAWQLLAQRGTPVVAEVAAEGGAGYSARGGRGGLFEDLTTRAVRPDDALVVFFGSRNDQDVDPGQLTGSIRHTLGLARRVAPSARLLVIGPAWPTAEAPDTVLRIRDILGAEAHVADAQFIDPIAEGWFVGRPDLIGADGVHPNNSGHTYLADKIVPLIGAFLPKPA